MTTPESPKSSRPPEAHHDSYATAEDYRAFVDYANALEGEVEQLRLVLRKWVPHDHSRQMSSERPINGCARCHMEADGVL